MEGLLILVVAALIGEAVWESLKMTWQEGKFSIDRLGALIIGLLIAVAGGLDLPKMIGVTLAVPFLGMILTGILISRGANFVHDLLGKLQKPGDVLKTLELTAETIPDVPVDNVAAAPVQATPQETRAPDGQ